MEICFPFTDFSSLSPVPCLSRSSKRPGLPRVTTKWRLIIIRVQGQFSRSLLQTNFQGYYECSACLVLASDLENLSHHEYAAYKSGRQKLFLLGSFFLPVQVSRVKCCMNNSEKFFFNSSFKGEVSTTVNLERWEDADVRLLITTNADNKHLFGGKATKKDVFEKIGEQFTKAFGRLVKRQREACERMGLATFPIEIFRICW